MRDTANVVQKTTSCTPCPLWITTPSVYQLNTPRRGPRSVAQTYGPQTVVGGHWSTCHGPSITDRGPIHRVDNRTNRSGPPYIGSFGGVWEPWDTRHGARAAHSWGRVHGPCFAQTFNKDSISALTVLY
mgnify:CR=1 FL=1